MSPVRLAFALVVMVTALGAMNLLVLRRTASAFGLSPRARRGLAIALGVPLAATVLFRVIAPLAPVGFGRPVAVAVSAVELAVILAGIVIGLAAVVELVIARASRKWRTATSPGVHRGADRPHDRLDDPPTGRGSVSPRSGSGETDVQIGGGAPPTILAKGADRRSPSSDEPHQGRGSAARTSSEPAIDPGMGHRRSARPVWSALAAPEEASPRARGTALPRRALVQKGVAGAAWAIGGGSALYGAVFGRHDYELSTVPVPIRGLPKAADGFTIVQLSDIHLGQMIGEGEMRAAEELVLRARGDLIVLTGDLVDFDARYTEHLGRLVRRLSAIRPVVAIPGNHDHYTGVDAVVSTIRAAGGAALVNQSTLPLGERQGFVLAGLDDVWARTSGGGPDLAAALAGTPDDLPRVVLCHNPKVFEDAAGQIALMLSGHTHGGQINVAVRPASVVLRHGWVAGLYETRGSHIYVNRGFGTAGPAARVGAPPEVSRIVLVSS